MIREIFMAVFAAVLVQNIVLVQLLGISPIVSASAKIRESVKIGSIVAFSIVIISVIAWTLYAYILAPLELEYLRMVAFALVAASLAKPAEKCLKRISPKQHEKLSANRSLIMVNCAVLGLALLVTQNEFSFLEMLVHSVLMSLGFLLVNILISGVNQRLQTSEVPKFMQGVPIMLVSAGLMAMAFLAFV